MMSDDSAVTISAFFATREEADQAVEHLVQEHGIDRSDVFVQASQAEGSSGTEASGADEPIHDEERSSLAPGLRGEIEVSADLTNEEASKAEAAFQTAGATRIERR
jgi:hypothetical protein